MDINLLKTIAGAVNEKYGRVRILVDNGHGYNTAGKHSPDKVVKEWHVNRDIAEAVVTLFRGIGMDAELLVPETVDISLGERCRRVNAQCSVLGKDKVLMLSCHLNAAGNGQWMSARGWSVWTTRGTTESDKLAECVWKRANERWHGQTDGLKTISDTSDGDHDYESDFYILRNTNCLAVLCENFFMDNREDYKYINSPGFHYDVAEVMVLGTMDYLKQKAKV